mmetsp:Transcript_20302/g.34658  ORF Transcript_20302/g.34658 Transcript_20302/m.34658 type:complete len:83 (-) Transcript_20302:45-293(-)
MNSSILKQRNIYKNFEPFLKIQKRTLTKRPVKKHQVPQAMKTTKTNRWLEALKREEMKREFYWKKAEEILMKEKELLKDLKN